MPVIGVTGVDGMIGWHVRAFYKSDEDVRIVPARRETFESDEELAAFVGQCDAIIHLAGQNRGDDEEVAAVNAGLAKSLVTACEKTGSKPHIVFSSSTHIYRDTVYGKSKLEATRIFTGWAERSGAVFTNMVLPHVFGEFGRPFYNSVVHTFCHQLAAGEEPKIIVDGDLELLHAEQVAAEASRVIREGAAGDVRMEGVKMKTSELLEKLREFDRLYRGGIIPDVRESMDLYLFNSYRSRLYPDFYPVELKLHTDDRGSLFEAVKSDNGGQSFVSTTRPGITRGNHYHTKKIERFLVVKGEASIKIRRLFSDSVEEFVVSGDSPRYVDMPTFYTHNITNVGNGELLTLFWAHEIFDPQNPDTIYEPV